MSCGLLRTVVRLLGSDGPGLHDASMQARFQQTRGATTRRTALFSQRETGGWLLSLRTDVRKRAGIICGNETEVSRVV